MIYGVTRDGGENIKAIGGNAEQELTRLIARAKKYGPIYRGFNQGNTKRFWYSCVIVSWLRSWFTLWASSEDFTALMYELCNHMENKGLWKENEGGAVHDIGDEFVRYMNARFPDKKVWKTKVKYGSSAMGGCLKRNIPIVTAYISSKEYENAHNDGEITLEETKGIKYGKSGHCITITGIGPLWSYLEFQDNYERFGPGNTYKTWFFRRVMDRTWFKECFYALLPEVMEATNIKERIEIIK